MKKKYLKNAAVFVTIVIIALIYGNLKESKLDKNGKYTIGKIENIFWAKGGMSCSYTYTVKDKNYESKNFIYGNQVKVGDFYYVKYNKNSPNHNELIFEKKAKNYDDLK
ncbi:hypothetical protein SAMN05444278_11028 [Psychroflexus salarius]|uniref:DUF3592 domain-containing protein n=1 Tax=Psychroflexus salarius TaxID=1155689 RepID=A0A1M4XR69_9FLAO|nr:hypothetical protein [Psychroflexus salarius]SHE96094.1 hypothetical protein SAMN05444278_11028 [Psychroflexus salarius]